MYSLYIQWHTTWLILACILARHVSYPVTYYKTNLACILSSDIFQDQSWPVSYPVTQYMTNPTCIISSSDKAAHGQSLPTPSVLLICPLSCSLFLCTFQLPPHVMVRHTTQHSKDTFLLFSVIYSTSWYTGGGRYSHSNIVRYRNSYCVFMHQHYNWYSLQLAYHFCHVAFTFYLCWAQVNCQLKIF